MFHFIVLYCILLYYIMFYWVVLHCEYRSEILIDSLSASLRSTCHHLPQHLFTVSNRITAELTWHTLPYRTVCSGVGGLHHFSERISFAIVRVTDALTDFLAGTLPSFQFILLSGSSLVNRRGASQHISFDFILFYFTALCNGVTDLPYQLRHQIFHFTIYLLFFSFTCPHLSRSI